MSIDVVAPIAEGTASGVLTVAVLVALKTIARSVRKRFPGVKIRILSDRHPSVTYEPPRDEDLDRAIEAIPEDYERQSRTEFVYKRWKPGRGWEVRFSRSYLVRQNPQAAVTVSKQRLKSRKRTKGAPSSEPGTFRAKVEAIESAARTGLRAGALALSEFDQALVDLGKLAHAARTRTERRAAAASEERLLRLRGREGKRLLVRWGSELRVHEGIDIGVPEGAAIYAARAGLVVEVGVEGYGNQSVKLRCQNVDIILGHLQSAVVSAGEEVAKGQVIGYAGSEGGISSGPHLHFEVRPAGASYGDTLDPWPFLEADDRQLNSGSYGADFDL